MADEWKVGVCDVCKILDADVRPKKVKHCGFCNSDICEKDINSARRIRAFAKQKHISLQGLIVWMKTH